MVMDTKEKLVQLIEKASYECNEGTHDLYDMREVADSIADFLIANGVTVQEWISVKEHLPQENEPEGAICEQVQVLLDNGVVSTGWCNRRTKLWWHLNYGETDFTGCDYEHTPVIAWMPLAQPPKGE